VKEVLAQIAPATRAYLLMCTFCTIVHVVGLPAPELFSLSTSKLYELWRPITSVAYFGPPSMSMANNIYFLVRYGQTLEALNGTGAHAWFLFVQTVLLSLLGYLFGFPFQASAMISATVYASSHLSPMQTMYVLLHCNMPPINMLTPDLRVLGIE
jgi:Der1-like family